MEKLYEEYGKLMIQSEIIQTKIIDLKRKIANELNSNTGQINNMVANKKKQDK